jgi:hypothetical protein
MTIWEKAVLNMQKGSRKIAAAAAVFSERVKAELAIIRLKIQIDQSRARMDTLYGRIGRTIVDLKRKGALPKTAEQLFKEDDIIAPMTELADGEREIEELKTQIKNISNDFTTVEKQTEDTLA